MSSQRLPIGSNLNMSCGPPMAVNGVPSPLMCSVPSLPMNAPMNGCNQWPAVWTTPPNAYHYNYQLNQSQAMQMMAANPFQGWPGMPGLVSSTQMAPQFVMNGGHNQNNVPSIQRFPNSCDNQSTHCLQSQSSTKSFDVQNSHSKNNHFNASQSHSTNYKSNQRNDRNTNNHYKRDINHKNNRSNHNHITSTQNKLIYNSSKRNSDSRGFYQDNTHNKGKDYSYESESKRKRLNSSKGSANARPNSETNDRYNESSTKSSNKKELSSMVITEQIFTKPVDWLRCSPADLFYQSQRDNPESVIATKKLVDLREKFRYELLERSQRALESKPKFVFPPRVMRLKPHKTIPSDDSSCSESESDDDDCEDTAYEELQRKKKHPLRLHEELWYNDPGEMNDGPLCRCSAKARKTGIRHGIYPGEEHLPPCDPNTNNRNRLYHYRIVINPNINFLTKFPTTIPHDGHEFVFEGYSLLSHWPLSNPIPCKVIRFNIEYTVTFVEEKFPTNFSVQDLDFFTRYVFQEILELVDLNLKANGDENGCSRFHFYPRFSRLLDDNGKELLSLNVILQYLLNSNKPVVNENNLNEYRNMNEEEWMAFAKNLKGMIVTNPGMKPSSLRVDQIDRESDDLSESRNNDDKSCDPKQDEPGPSKAKADDGYPVIVHFGIRPPQLSYAGNPKYQKAWRDYVKFRHLLANKKKVSYIDKQTLLQKEEKLQEMRMKNDLKRDVTVVLSSKGFYTTGIQCDIIQHSLLLPVLVCHLRFHQSLQYLEGNIGYTFADRYLLQLALTHPSYRENFGTNPDHARNALTNCGIRQPQYGDRRVHFMNTRKRGINMLINIMSRFGCNEETTSNINHNERLEFLGDAVVEFMTSIHLYFMFPDLEEGGLATYRAALVQNQQLAVLAKKLSLEKFMLYAHGSDLCHDLELRHAMANCFEALMGALFLDGGIDVADRIFSKTLFIDETHLHDIWVNYPKHPLQSQEPNGDRHYIENIPRLKELLKFEELTGIEFFHIRLLARAFTHRSIGFNNLTLGSNQRMEFLGDTVLQLVASEYLYKFFPEHHEGHLSLLRSSLVNNKTQAVVCDDLGMTSIAIYNYAKGELKTKDRADLLEAFLGALYVDKGLTFCRVFCEVCFFPRLEQFIMNQDWNDPKSKLQQCCLTLRSVDGGEPDIPVYKVIECRGPTNTRVYVVAVYFRDQRLATGKGHSIQEAEMNAASNALESSRELFPQLNHQKKVIERSVKTVKAQEKSGKEKRRERSDKSDCIKSERGIKRLKNDRNEKLTKINI